MRSRRALHNPTVSDHKSVHIGKSGLERVPGYAKIAVMNRKKVGSWNNSRYPTQVGSLDVLDRIRHFRCVPYHGWLLEEEGILKTSCAHVDNPHEDNTITLVGRTSNESACRKWFLIWKCFHPRATTAPTLLPSPRPRQASRFYTQDSTPWLHRHAKQACLNHERTPFKPEILSVALCKRSGLRPGRCGPHHPGDVFSKQLLLLHDDHVPAKTTIDHSGAAVFC